MTKQQNESALDQQFNEVVDRLTIREGILDALLDKLSQDRYPSPTMLDMIEQLMTPWRRRDYAEILIEKIRNDKYPSLQLLRRVSRLGS